MVFSNSCQYAIKSCIYLSNNRSKIDVKEIAEYINSPISFTSKILQKLAKNQIISSSKGKNGGFFLTDFQYSNNKIRDIFLVFDDATKLNKCYFLHSFNIEKANSVEMYIILLK